MHLILVSVMASERTLFGGLRLTPLKLTWLRRQVLFFKKTSTWLPSSAHLPSSTCSDIHATDNHAEERAAAHAAREGNMPQASWEWVLWPLSWQRACHAALVSPLGFPAIPMVCKFRKYFRAGSDTHTRWDTPPGSETIPSCGWYAPHARRSGRNWTTLELPRGRWRTGT